MFLFIVPSTSHRCITECVWQDLLRTTMQTSSTECRRLVQKDTILPLFPSLVHTRTGHRRKLFLSTHFKCNFMTHLTGIMCVRGLRVHLLSASECSSGDVKTEMKHGTKHQSQISVPSIVHSQTHQTSDWPNVCPMSSFLCKRLSQ